MIVRVTQDDLYRLYGQLVLSWEMSLANNIDIDKKDEFWRIFEDWRGD